MKLVHLQQKENFEFQTFLESNPCNPQGIHFSSPLAPPLADGKTSLFGKFQT